MKRINQNTIKLSNKEVRNFSVSDSLCEAIFTIAKELQAEYALIFEKELPDANENFLYSLAKMELEKKLNELLPIIKRLKKQSSKKDNLEIEVNVGSIIQKILNYILSISHINGLPLSSLDYFNEINEMAS